MDEYRTIQQRIQTHRRKLHQIPEVGSILPETSQYVREQLRAMGIPFHSSQTDSSITALIQGDGSPRCIALRADMDALPIQEETGLPFASRHPDCMHACGHDAHTAMLLGAAELLQARRSELHGSVKLLFQANEEFCLGAKQMIADGALDSPKVDALLALHIGALDPGLELGQLGIYPGSVMASSDRFDIFLFGEGGHCSRPDQAVSPVTAAAQLIGALQGIVSQETNVLEPRVFTVTSVEAGNSYNTIPNTARIRGNIRAFHPDTQTHMVKRLHEVTQGIAQALRVQARVEVVTAAPVLENDPEFAALAAQAARTFLPEDQVKTVQRFPILGSEDAAFFHQHIPGVFCFLSSVNPEKHTDFANHNSRFDLDEDVLWEGCALFVTTALRFLGP